MELLVLYAVVIVALAVAAVMHGADSRPGLDDEPRRSI